MEKEFNTEGVCIPEQHYLVDVSSKLEAIFPLIQKGKYFTINRPRQFGKTTTFFFLFRYLQKTEDYFPIKLSFEELDAGHYESSASFIEGFLFQLQNFLRVNQHQELADFIQSHSSVKYFDQFGHLMTRFILETRKKVVLLIDEIDKSTNYQLFLDFLGILRSKYLLQKEGQDATFHSVVLAGVHDIKSLKLKITPSKEQKTAMNSHWNIAANFDVDMSFQPAEIGVMLKNYSEEIKGKMDCFSIAEKLHYYTSGYPFLVSKLCKIIDEKLMTENKEWKIEMVELAVQRLLKENNTNFESLIKNLEDNPELSKLVEKIILDGAQIEYSEDNTLTRLGVLHGIFRNNGNVKIHNRIFEQRIYNYLVINLHVQNLIDNRISENTLQEDFVFQDGSLDFEKILLKFQFFMKEEHSKKDNEFVERNGRLLFLSFLRPILNGKGFDFKEAQSSEEKRLDVVVTFLHQKFVIELKIWRGLKAHEKGLLQLADYLERWDLTQGYLLIFDLRKEQNKEWKTERKTVNKKEILSVWV